MECTLTLAMLAAMVSTSLAGYSFPVAAENFATENFQTINPDMEFDWTNFLVDLSGRFSQCSVVSSRQSGSIDVSKETFEGKTVYGLVDTELGRGSDSDSLTRYIESMFKRWLNQDPFRAQIVSSNRFGCSIQPDCSGYAVVACMFSST